MHRAIPIVFACSLALARAGSADDVVSAAPPTIPMILEIKALAAAKVVLEYVLGTAPGPGRNGQPPNPELFPENNPVLRPPVAGKVGLWAKGDST